MKRILHIFTALMLCSLSITPLSIHAGSDVYISDTYGVLSQAEVDQLNAQAQQISDQYQFGVYAHILYDDASYDDIWGYIEQYYAEQDLGYRNTSDGILFLITQSSQGGSYDIYIPAASNQSYFTIDGLEDIQDDAELMAIFQRTFGNIKQERAGWRRSTRSYHTDEYEMLRNILPEYTTVFAQNYDSAFLFYPYSIVCWMIFFKYF